MRTYLSSMACPCVWQMPILSGSLLAPASKPVGTASSIRRDDDDAIATHPYDDYSHPHLQQQQHKQLDEARYEALRPVKDAASTLGSELSVLALRSTCGSYASTEAGSPLVTHQGPAEASVDELRTPRRLQAVEHIEDVHDSGVCELADFLNR